MRARGAFGNVNMRVCVLVASCFLLTSIGYLIWLYRLMSVSPPDQSVEMATLVLGYLFQALGIGAYATLMHRNSRFDARRTVLVSVAAYPACLLFTMLGENPGTVLAFGYVSNLLCGIIAAYYLQCLARDVPKNRRGIVFGCGYAIATFASWLLSLPLDGRFLQSEASLIACIALAIGAAVCIRGTSCDDGLTPGASPLGESLQEASRGDSGKHRVGRNLLVLAAVMVFAICLVKSLGNSFSSAGIEVGLDLELSRLFYAAGLFIAGLLSDRDRRIGMACCIAALAMPFISLSLAGIPAPSFAIWSLEYFLFGFFAVYRVILFADLAEESGRLWLSGWGLMLGRLGDSCGVCLCLLLSDLPTHLVVIAAVLFAVSVLLAFLLYQLLYNSPAPRDYDDRIAFEAFAVRYQLSAREREVLRLLLDDHTNQEIAAKLVVSENTVKFHVRNLLKKTGCKSRQELRTKYLKQGLLSRGA